MYFFINIKGLSFLPFSLFLMPFTDFSSINFSFSKYVMNPFHDLFVSNGNNYKRASNGL